MIQRLKQAFYNISKFVSYITGSEVLSFHPGTRLERQKKIMVWGVIAGLSILIFIVLYFYLTWNKLYLSILNHDIDDIHWLGFISSFWGAIIGSIISGIATVITTWLIIRRSRRIDYHRERVESLPILQLSVRKDIESEIKKDRLRKTVIRKYKIWNREWEELADGFIVFEVKNVGKGIAISPGISNEAEEAVFGAPSFSSIVSQESVYFIESLDYIFNSEIVFSFFDIFDNYYEQHFTLKTDDKEQVFDIEMKIPQLVMKTQRIRYEQ